MLQIRFKEPPVSKVSHLGVRVFLNLFVNVDIIFTEAVEKGSPEISRIGDICNLMHLSWQRKVDQVSDPGKGYVLQAFLRS